MKLQEVLDFVDKIKPGNPYDAATKIQWVNELEGDIQSKLLNTAPQEIIQYTETDTAEELLVPVPFDKVYWMWVSAMIDFANGEYDKYQNTLQMVNDAYDKYAKWFHRKFHQDTGSFLFIGGTTKYGLSAFEIAVNHGFAGTEEEWLVSLKGEPGAGIDVGYNAETGNVKIVNLSGGTGGVGADGVGIDYISFKEKSEEGNVYTIELTDGSQYEFTAPEGDPGDKGDPGDPGVGIASISFKDETDEGNVYTIALTNGDTCDFVAPKGEKGDPGDGSSSGGGDMLASVYDPQGKATDIYQYVDDARNGELTTGEVTEKYGIEGCTATYAVRRIGNFIDVVVTPNIPASLAGYVYLNAHNFQFEIPLPVALSYFCPTPKKTPVYANDQNGSRLLGHASANTSSVNTVCVVSFNLLSDRQYDCNSAMTWLLHFSDSDIITEGGAE